MMTCEVSNPNLVDPGWVCDGTDLVIVGYSDRIPVVLKYYDFPGWAEKYANRLPEWVCNDHWFGHEFTGGDHLHMRLVQPE